MSGRDLFTYNPDMAGEDDEEAQTGNIEREADEQEVLVFVQKSVFVFLNLFLGRR